MRKRFRLFVVFMATLLCVTYPCIVSAENVSRATANSFSGLIFSDGKQVVLSEYDKEMIAQKKAQAEALANRPMTRAATLISIANDMTFYQQEEIYYCAPACVKMMLKYLTGDAYAQESLGRLMGTIEGSGTPTDRVAPCLNSIQDDFYYVHEREPDGVVMKNYIYSTVAYNRVPAKMGIVNPDGTNWSYSTTGHSLVVCGIYSDESMIQFMDPLGETEWVSNCPAVYLKESSFVSEICQNLVW